MLSGGTPRLVFRKTNRYIVAQYLISKEAKDEVKIGVTSKILLNYKWPKEAVGSLKSATAAYLIGLLIGKKIVANNLEKPIVDFGMYRILPKSKPHAFIKGVIDSGLKLEDKSEMFPSEEQIGGKYLKNKINFKEIKSNIEANLLEKTSKKSKGKTLKLDK